MDEGADRGLVAAAGSAGRSRRAWSGWASSGSRSTSTHASDPDVAQEETLAAFDELVREGIVGAVGASNYTAEQVAEALELSAREGLTRYEWVQNAFSLLEQGDRQTMFPLCHEHGLGYAPFGPLAGGWLTGKYRRGEEAPAGSRMTLRPEGGRGIPPPTRHLLRSRHSSAMRETRGVSMAALALAWLLHLSELTAIVVGPNERGAAHPRPGCVDSGSTPTSTHGSERCSREFARALRGGRPCVARHGVLHRRRWRTSSPRSRATS